MGAGIQRKPMDRDAMDLFGLRESRGMGKRRIRFTPQPHFKSSRITPVFGVRSRQLSLFPNVGDRPRSAVSALNLLGTQPTGHRILAF